MSFTDERKEYLDMIKTDFIFLNALLDDEKTNERYKMIVIDPKTSKELEFAKEIYKYINNSNKIIEETDVIIPVNEMEFGQLGYVNYLKEVIMALKNRDIVKLRESKRITPEEEGKLSFQAYYLTEYYYNEYASFLAEECGFNINNVYEDGLDIIKFGIYLNNASKIFDKQTNYLKLLENYPLDNNHGVLEIVKSYLTGFNEEYNKTMDKVIEFYNKKLNSINNRKNLQL